MAKCFICKKTKIMPFAKTPVLEDEKGNMHKCCEKCADKYFPGWNEELDETVEKFGVYDD